MDRKVQVLDFVKINPAGNITILIDNFDIYDKNIPKISEEIMKENKDFSEQKNYSITCSGENEVLDVDVREDGAKNKFLAKIKMPKFISLEEIKIDGYKLGLVRFSGINHFIFNIKENKEVSFENIIDLVKKYLSNENYSAFGIMFFDRDNLSMKPYVYVKEVGSGVYENSCASGTTALGYYLKKYKNLDRAKIIQPNGWLEYIIENNEIYIDGPVEIIAEGKVCIGK